METSAARAFSDVWGVETVLSRFAGNPAGTFIKYWRVKLTFKGVERLILAHRIIFALTHDRWPVADLDHEDRNRTINQIGNLREATPSQNNQNQGLRSDNTSGVKGVYWHKKARKWQGYISVNGRRLHLGLHPTRERAEAAVLMVRSLLHPFAPKPPVQPGRPQWRFYEGGRDAAKPAEIDHCTG